MKDLEYKIQNEDKNKTLSILFRWPGDMVSEVEWEITIGDDQVGRFLYEILGSFFLAQLRSIPTDEDRKAFIDNTPIAELIDSCKLNFDQATRIKLLKDFSFSIK